MIRTLNQWFNLNTYSCIGRYTIASFVMNEYMHAICTQHNVYVSSTHYCSFLKQLSDSANYNSVIINIYTNVQREHSFVEYPRQLADRLQYYNNNYESTHRDRLNINNRLNMLVNI